MKKHQLTTKDCRATCLNSRGRKVITMKNEIFHNNLTKIIILKIKKITSSNLRALVDIQLGNIIINGCRVVQQPNQKPWVAFPQQQSNSDSKWYSVIQCTDPSLDKAIKEQILAAYQEAQHEQK